MCNINPCVGHEFNLDSHSNLNLNSHYNMNMNLWLRIISIPI